MNLNNLEMQKSTKPPRQARRLIFFSFIILVFGFTNLKAQSYIGHAVDNYSGIHSVIYNPANIVSSNLRADVNIVSASGLIDNDYLAINISDLIESPDDFDFDKASAESPSNRNNFFFNADVVGPSFMFNLNKKSSIGIISRARGIFSLNDINGKLYQNVVDGFEADTDFDFNSPDLVGTMHVWAEIGLSYGRILMTKPNHLLTGGVTLKYLQGAGSLYINTPGLSGQYTAANETLQSQGSLNYGTTQGFDNNDIDFSNLTAGFGLDVGFTYEYHPKRDNDDIRYFQDPYKFKVGLSVTDIGSINYNNATVTSYDLNDTVSTATWQDDVEEFLENNYENTASGQSVALQLPTVLHLLLDYRLTKKILISAQGNFGLTDSENALSSRMTNTLTLSPRFETKWFSAYIPLSLRQYGGFVFGGGFRLGPLTVGSGSIFSNLISDTSKTADVFVGLKIPLYRK